MLGEVITKIGGTRGPIDPNVLLRGSVLEPVEMHVHGVGVVDLHGVIGKATSNFVVGPNGHGGLLMTKQFQCVP